MPGAFILGIDWSLELKASSIRKRVQELNRRNFPSEAWFERMLFDHDIGGYYRNPPLLNRYFGDFVWFNEKIVIEIDGKSHVGKEEYDKQRDEQITAAGFRVCRIKTGDTEHAMRVLERLKQVVDSKRVVKPLFKVGREKKERRKRKKRRLSGSVTPCYTDSNKRILDDLNRRRQSWVHPGKRKG